jgi:hypothetical protein
MTPSFKTTPAEAIDGACLDPTPTPAAPSSNQRSRRVGQGPDATDPSSTSAFSVRGTSGHTPDSARSRFAEVEGELESTRKEHFMPMKS